MAFSVGSIREKEVSREMEAMDPRVCVRRESGD
jgi:hypothetical protein